MDVLSKLSYTLIPSNNTAFSFIRGPQVNLESMYSFVSFAKRFGFNSIFQTYASAQLNVDIPLFYSFNRTVESLVEKPLGGLILLNSNLRYEASLINTIIRREQNRRSSTYITIGAFKSLRYNHQHAGNSFRLVLSSLENRLSFFKLRLQATNGSTGIFVGVESLRNQYGFFSQIIGRFLGKRLFTKTSKEDRLGFIHSTLGSLAFAHQGVSSKPYAHEKVSFTFSQPQVSKSFFKRYSKSHSIESHIISFDTHSNSLAEFTKIANQVNLPITSLYERNGSFRVFEGRLRKHYKAVTPIEDRRDFEVILSALVRKQGLFQWFS